MTPAGPIRVTGKDGLSGTVQASSRRVKQRGDVSLVLDGGQELRVPADMLEEREDGTYFLPLSLEELRSGSDPYSDEWDQRIVLPLVEEQLRVRHQRSGNRQHLLLSSGESACELPAPLEKHREEAEARLRVALDFLRVPP